MVMVRLRPGLVFFTTFFLDQIRFWYQLVSYTHEQLRQSFPAPSGGLLGTSQPECLTMDSQRTPPAGYVGDRGSD